MVELGGRGPKPGGRIPPTPAMGDDAGPGGGGIEGVPPG